MNNISNNCSSKSIGNGNGDSNCNNLMSDPLFRLELVPSAWVWDPRADTNRKEGSTITERNNNNDDDNNIDDKSNNGGRNARSNTLRIEDPRRLAMVAAIFEELRRTDNILVTEIGRRGLSRYFHDGWMSSSSGGFRHDDDHRDGDRRRRPVPDVNLQNDASFRFLAEVLQANMIHFLERRYFGPDRNRREGGGCGRHTGSSLPSDHGTNRRGGGIAGDFRAIFDKASSSRYLANREAIVEHCFRKRPPQRPQQRQQSGSSSTRLPMDGGAGGCTGDGGNIERELSPTTIRRALLRLHLRAGIYLPHGDGDDADADDTYSSYWIDLWWLCSTLLGWILDPCVTVMRSIGERSVAARDIEDPSRPGKNRRHDHQGEPPASKRRRTESTHGKLHGNDGNGDDGDNDDDDDDGEAGFAKQSRRVWWIPFRMIEAEAQRVGLFYDRVLLHNGPWENEPGTDKDYVPNRFHEDVHDDDYDDEYSWSGEEEDCGSDAPSSATTTTTTTTKNNIHNVAPTDESSIGCPCRMGARDSTSTVALHNDEETGGDGNGMMHAVLRNEYLNRMNTSWQPQDATKADVNQYHHHNHHPSNNQKVFCPKEPNAKAMVGHPSLWADAASLTTTTTKTHEPESRHNTIVMPEEVVGV